MASGSTTSAFTDSDNTQILDSECNDYTSRTGKEDPTIIESKVTVITEKKKLKVCTKFTVPHAQHVYLAMKISEAVIEKTQDLSG